METQAKPEARALPAAGRHAMRVEIAGGDIVVDAEMLAPMFDIPAEDVPGLMRTQAITSICERGAGEDEGRYRLSFFYRNRRVRLSIDPAGRVLQRSAVDFGERALPAQLHRPGR